MAELLHSGAIGPNPASSFWAACRAIAAIFFGVQHFLHPLGLPGVPLAKQMPPCIPVRTLIDYMMGAFLIAAGVCFLLSQKTRTAATYLGMWIVLLVVVIYGPVLIGALAGPSTGVQVEGVNYFADTPAI